MSYVRLAGSVALAVLGASGARAQISSQAPGVNVNVPLPSDNGSSCRKMKVNTPYGVRKQWFCLAADGQWYPRDAAPAGDGIHPVIGYDSAPGAEPPPGYSQSTANVSGEWRTPSGGYFEVSQSGNHVTWEAHSADGYSWSNHFDGDIRGNVLSGYFYDHPSRHYHNAGPLTFRIDGPRMIRMNDTRAFADNMLIRGDAYAADARQQHYGYAQEAQPAPAERAGPVTKLDEAVNRLVSLDAGSWGMNRYDDGSARNSRVLDRSKTCYTVYGQYTYNGGRPGWVKIQFSGKKPQCIEFWDFAGSCRAIGHSPGRAMAAAAVGAVAAGVAGGGGGGGGGSAADQGNYSGMTTQQYQDMQEQRQIQQQQQQQMNTLNGN